MITPKKPIRTRLYVNGDFLPTLLLTDSESLGIRKSVRLQKDDWVGCFNGDGREYIYRISDTTNTRIELELMEHYPNPADEIPGTCISIASTKGKTKDRMVKDLTPLGATRIQFYHADRSVAKPEPDHAKRLQKIAIEACRQCGRSTIPTIGIYPHSLMTLMQECQPKESFIIFYESSSEWNVKSDWFIPGKSFHLVFGPEGGFSDEEVNFFMTRNVNLATLGVRILRSELAVVVGTTLVQEKRGLFSNKGEVRHEGFDCQS